MGSEGAKREEEKRGEEKREIEKERPERDESSPELYTLNVFLRPRVTAYFRVLKSFNEDQFDQPAT